MLPNLSAEEARIIGCLIEKSIVTPDQYPLTLNSLTNACNQKSGRNPVMNLTKGEVQRITRLLSGKNLLRINENFKSSVEKYSQLLCNTRYNEFKFDDGQLALVCVLLLRGAQTPGELRTHCRRLFEFPDNDSVKASLDSLVNHERGPLVTQLPRTPGRKDSEYMHRFSGEVAVTEIAAADNARPAVAPAARKVANTSGLAERVTILERQVAELRQMLGKEN